MNKILKRVGTGLLALVLAIGVLGIDRASAMSDKQAAYLFGGIAGGLVLGEVLGGPGYAPPPQYYAPQPQYYAPQPQYYAPQPVYAQECYIKIIRRFNPNTNNYTKVKKRVCY